MAVDIASGSSVDQSDPDPDRPELENPIGGPADLKESVM